MSLSTTVSTPAIARATILAAICLQAARANASDCSTQFDPALCFCDLTATYLLVGSFVDVDGDTRFLIEEAHTRADDRYAAGQILDIAIPISHGFGDRFVITTTTGEYWSSNLISPEGQISYLGSGSSTSDGTTFEEAYGIPRDAVAVAEALAAWNTDCFTEVRRDLELPPRPSCFDGDGCAGGDDSPSWALMLAAAIFLTRFQRN